VRVRTVPGASPGGNRAVQAAVRDARQARRPAVHPWRLLAGPEDGGHRRHQPCLDPGRSSFTAALDTARDQVTTAGGVLTSGVAVLTGAIGRAVLDNLLPARRRQRIKARTRKNPTSKYSKNSVQHPATAQHYTPNAEVMVMEQGLTARPKR
jgi:hypothetical protein